MEVALRILAIREHSAHQLLQKLQQRKIENAQEIIDECISLGYIDDQRFAEIYTRSLLNRGKGPYYIYNKLREAGVEPIEITPDQEREYLAKLAHLKPKALERRGFSRSLIIELQ